MSKRRPESYMEPGDTDYARRRLQSYRRRQKLIRTAKGAGRIAWNIFLAFGEAAKLTPGYSEFPQNPPQTEE